MTGRCTVFIGDGPWRVACVTDGRARVQAVEHAEDATPGERAAAVAAVLAGLGRAGPVVVALPSSWCLSASVATDGLGRSNRRQSMHYLLEEQLPLSAEDAVADYAERQGRALGVAAELGRLRPILEALEEAGVAVRHLCPAALLAAAHLRVAHTEADAVVLASGACYDFIELARGLPARWWWLTDPAALTEAVEAWREGDEDAAPTGLVSLGRTPALPGIETVSADARDPDTDAADADEHPTEHAAALEGARLLAGEVSAWVDLRRDALALPDRYARYQKRAGLLAAAVALLLVSVSAAMFWRGRQYAGQADALVAQQVGVFKAALPGQRVPPSIRSRLQSEQRRLAGMSGRAAIDGDDALHPPSALTQLHTVLTAWPEGLRYQVKDLTIEPVLIRVTGQAADPVTAAQLTTALRSTGVYDVGAPDTRALGDFGVGYDFIARPKADNQPGAAP